MQTTQIIQMIFTGASRNLLLGAGLCYAVQNERYLHVPLIVVFPLPYAGYHMYKHKDHFIHLLKLETPSDKAIESIELPR